MSTTTYSLGAVDQVVEVQLHSAELGVVAGDTEIALLHLPQTGETRQRGTRHSWISFRYPANFSSPSTLRGPLMPSL